MNTKYVIEHLDDKLYDWSILEYQHASKMVGKKNILFTNIKKSDIKKLKIYGEVTTKSVLELNLKNACLLDPKAKRILSPKDKFDYYIFGGILGNHPMDGRTDKELGQIKVQKRNLGQEQMSTNTAVIVTKRIIDGRKFSDLKFKDTLEIDLGDNFSNILPYRYLVENKKVVLPPKFKSFLKKQEDNM